MPRSLRPMISSSRLLALTLGLMMLAACTTTTPYQQAVGRGDGYTEQRLESDKYRISVRGNSVTEQATLENYVIFRAAEITLASGNDYFIMLEDSTEVRRSFNSYGTTFGGGGFGRRGCFYGGGFGRGFGRSGFGGGGFGTTSTRTREITEYTVGAIVQVFSGTKPAENITAYDARSVIENLGPSLLRPAN